MHPNPRYPIVGGPRALSPPGACICTVFHRHMAEGGVTTPWQCEQKTWLPPCHCSKECRSSSLPPRPPAVPPQSRPPASWRRLEEPDSEKSGEAGQQNRRTERLEPARLGHSTFSRIAIACSSTGVLLGPKKSWPCSVLKRALIFQRARTCCQS